MELKCQGDRQALHVRWRLAPVLKTELGHQGVVAKAMAAGLSGVWIMIADWAKAYENVRGAIALQVTSDAALAKREGLAMDMRRLASIKATLTVCRPAAPAPRLVIRLENPSLTGTKRTRRMVGGQLAARRDKRMFAGD